MFLNAVETIEKAYQQKKYGVKMNKKLHRQVNKMQTNCKNVVPQSAIAQQYRL